MNDKNNNFVNQSLSETNFIKEFLIIAFTKKILIFSITSIMTALFVFISLSIPNIYKSEALLMQSQSQQSSLGMLNQYSSVASFAGITLPSNSGDRSQEAIERIKSYEFFINYFLPNILLENLMASKSWNSFTDTILYDDKIFDSSTDMWIRKVSPPAKPRPSGQDAFLAYKKIMEISQDKKTGFVTVSVKHLSPNIAKQWTQNIIVSINQSMRDQEKNKTMLAINFLNNEAQKINYEDIKKAITNLQQEQMKSLMLIEANEEFVFKVLDSPIAPERKFEPRRSIIVFWGFMLGIVLSLIVIFFTDLKNKTFK